MVEIETFKEEVNKSELPFLVLFWGSGCSPCDKIKPVFDQVSEANRDKARFVSLKANDNFKLAGHYKVMAVPTLIYTDNLGNVRRLIGPKTKQDIEDFISD